MGAHFLLLPFAEQGHINPMLSLASQLAAMDCKVTFVKAAKRVDVDAHDAVVVESRPPTPESLLRFVTLIDACNRDQSAENPTSMSSRYHIMQTTLAALQRQQRRLEEIVQESKASAHPISCVICDILIWKWVKQLAHKQGLHIAVFVPFGALSFYTSYLGRDGKDTEREELYVYGFNMPKEGDPRRYGVGNIRDSPEVKIQKMKFFYSLSDGLEDANAHILINSFKHLEAPLLPSLEGSCLDVKFIGPCFPSWNEDVGMGIRMARQAGSAFEQDAACLVWLDRQESRSVLFVSLGSEGIVDEEQVEELTMGVERSGHKFLWVVRPDAPASSWPSKEFRTRSCKQGDKSRGMFVSWAPQSKVLQHRAVGGFLTHSGWNSTLESMMSGVPMLCLPLIADQPWNANLVERYWRVGMRLVAQTVGEESGRTVVGREEVERGVRAVMEGRYAQQVLQLQQAAQAATVEAHHTLASFVHGIKSSTLVKVP